MTKTITETINVQIACDLEMDEEEFFEFLEGIPNFSENLEGGHYDWYRHHCRQMGIKERDFFTFKEWVWSNREKILKEHAQRINEHAFDEVFG